MADDWTVEAGAAIQLCEKWAEEPLKLLGGKLYLFGSAIYRGGDQFDSVSSDLDIIYVFSDNTSALDRYNTLLRLKEHKKKLELNMIPALGRENCVEPGVSIVAITELELKCNIHKSGARSFFNTNIFYDLESKKEQYGIENAGTSMVPEEQRQALEYAQKVRNEFLSVGANSSGGMKSYSGYDPLPKALVRSAAQLVPEVAVGEWYDTLIGLEFLHAKLDKVRTEADEYKKLSRKLSVRRGGRGRREELTDCDQLLLAEILFASAETAPLVVLVTWEIKIGDTSYSEANVQKIFSEIKKAIPDARLVHHRQGSVVLTVRSSPFSLHMLRTLHEVNALSELLKMKVISVQEVDLNNVQGSDSKNGGLEVLLQVIEQWRPMYRSGRQLEHDFDRYLLEKIRDLKELFGATVYSDVALEKPLHHFDALDFVVVWEKSTGEKERVGIELAWISSRSSFFKRVEYLLSVNFSTILVLAGPNGFAEQYAQDIQRLRRSAPNINTVLLEIPEGRNLGRTPTGA